MQKFPRKNAAIYLRRSCMGVSCRIFYVCFDRVDALLIS